MPTTYTPRQRLAAHEAGKAVAGVYYGLPPAGIDLDRVGFKIPPRSSHPDYGRIFVNAAGPAAETLLCGPTPGTHGRKGSVWDSFEDAKRLCGGDGIRASELLFKVRPRVEEFVNDNGWLLFELADYLDGSGFMTAMDVYAFVRPALNTNPKYATLPAVPVPMTPPDVFGESVPSVPPANYAKGSHHDRRTPLACVRSRS